MRGKVRNYTGNKKANKEIFLCDKCQIEQLFLLLLNINFVQEYLGLLLLLHVKDYLERQEAANSG